MQLPTRFEDLYTTVHKLQAPLYADLEDSVIVSKVLLNEFNRKPDWPLSIPLADFLEQLVLQIDDL